ncbi:hypothetical protein [Amycolatopsis pigmentata]|uniref:Secreted protein n=1 Tax=Amycolatopsis pigmentata TaxID=450801 RepID=A0ABW5FPJ7_9PSEU
MGLPKIALLAAGSAAVALGGCSEAQPGPRAPAEAPASALPPGTTEPPSPATTDPSSSCGTLRAASGLTLRVEGLPGDPDGCADARRLVDELQKRLAAIGAGGHDGQVAVAVQDWLCVSRPDSAGGATCSRHDETVSAEVVPGR